MALLSAALLTTSFPNFNQPWCAWVALAPWLLLLRRVGGRAAFGWSWFVGLCFFLGSMAWLLQLTKFGGAAAILGWLVLCAYLALFFGCFGWFAHRIFASHLTPLTSHLAVAAAWVALEYARSHLLTGFGWNLLAYSQTPWRPVIQIADLTGAWGVSFLIVVVNGLIALWLGGGRSGSFTRGTPKEGPRGNGPRQPAPRERVQLMTHTAVVIGVLLVGVLYGVWRPGQLERGPTVKVAVVQGNIPQEHKWDEAYQAKIERQYAALTDAAARTRPDLIVWPETSVPGFFDADEALTQWVSGMAVRAGRPLLIGAPVPTIRNVRFTLTNSAVLLDEEGAVLQRYDKLHLVPFGEFVPFERSAPWLRQLLPPIGDFVPGHSLTVFTTLIRNAEFGMRSSEWLSLRTPHSELQTGTLRTPHSALKFSVLICFEDVFPDLARRFVLEGARLLLVITNDAWFGPTAAAYQHTQASIFPAVELRVPVARAANTGWSGCIDATGRQTGSVRDDQGRELFIQGIHTCELPLTGASSLYRRMGDWFALLCLLASVGWLGLVRARR